MNDYNDNIKKLSNNKNIFIDFNDIDNVETPQSSETNIEIKTEKLLEEMLGIIGKKFMIDDNIYMVVDIKTKEKIKTKDILNKKKVKYVYLYKILMISTNLDLEDIENDIYISITLNNIKRYKLAQLTINEYNNGGRRKYINLIKKLRIINEKYPDNF
jgi:hypothetical protein